MTEDIITIPKTLTGAVLILDACIQREVFEAHHVKVDTGRDDVADANAALFWRGQQVSHKWRGGYIRRKCRADEREWFDGRLQRHAALDDVGLRMRAAEQIIVAHHHADILGEVVGEIGEGDIAVAGRGMAVTADGRPVRAASEITRELLQVAADGLSLRCYPRQHHCREADDVFEFCFHKFVLRQD